MQVKVPLWHPRAPAARGLVALHHRRRCANVAVVAWLGHTPQTPVYCLDVITETGSFVYRHSFSGVSPAPRDDSAQQEVVVGELPRREPHSDEWTWQLFGSCRKLDVDVFFPPPTEPAPIRAEQEAIAKKVCSTCPVREACLRHALASNEAYGIWGGMSEYERAPVIRRSARFPAA